MARTARGCFFFRSAYRERTSSSTSATVRGFGGVQLFSSFFTSSCTFATVRSVPSTLKRVEDGGGVGSLRVSRRILSTKIDSPLRGRYRKTSKRTTLPNFELIALYSLGWRTPVISFFPGRRRSEERRVGK